MYNLTLLLLIAKLSKIALFTFSKKVKEKRKGKVIVCTLY